MNCAMKNSMLICATATVTVAVALFYKKNHLRVRRAKSCMHAIVRFPPPGIARKPFPIILLAGSSQKANVWARRVEFLTAAGYECHALDFVQTGRYFTSYREQLLRLRQYITENLEEQRPVLIGHSQGGSKAQLYLTAADGDASVEAESRVRACILMSSMEPSFLGTSLHVVPWLMQTAGMLRVLAAGTLGAFYLDPICFCFGGGPWRHDLGLYRALFNDATATTTLATVQTILDARVGYVAPAAGASSSQGVPLAAWADACISDHDPCICDHVGLVPQARSPAEARKATRCKLLHLVGETDRIVPRAQSERIARCWQVPMTVVHGQGHQLADSGWEQSVMEPIQTFLDGLMCE